ncbi:ZIP family metal transporter [Halostagnicola sp. A-GB9-2]|uniref:ZIP family metal transporter n=1 Tax=Halostagnicola sp. A-GB9-2 TaxID=3048066 RepID=UPI0024C062AE|nr:ZIP family metal transporter [Halostagnicola sp. A-GB9-2]MDJ1434663.1 ZIP family metal transporter [Halostagnicola sp. A-GB9-2]
MPVTDELLLVFIAGLVTGLATGLGALPFFLVREVTDRWLVVLWGVATGVLFSASTVGLLAEGVADGSFGHVLVGCLAGVGFVFVADRIIANWNVPAQQDPTADYRMVVLAVGVLTLHSIPEGIAVGVAFADIGHETEVVLGDVAVSTLAVYMTLAVSIINIPEGLAIAIPLIAYGMNRWKVVGWAVFSGLPQPLGAVLAYQLATSIEALLPMSFGFAAGALLYLVFSEYLPAGIANGTDLPRKGRPELVCGVAVGLVAMLALLVMIE